MEIIKDNETLHNNGLYLAALCRYTDGTEKILIDDCFDKLPKLVKTFVVLHEMGHRNGQIVETIADSYAISKLGKTRTWIAMLYLYRMFLKLDWTVSAQYLVRAYDAGLKVMKYTHVTSPDGKKWGVDDIRPLNTDNHV